MALAEPWILSQDGDMWKTWALAIGSCIAVFVAVWMLAPKSTSTLCFTTDVEVATCRVMEMSARRELGEKLELIERQRLEIEKLKLLLAGRR